MKMFKRYDKSVMEEFALRVIKKSYSEEYGRYYSPSNTDNFDFVSKDHNKGLEVTSIIPQNEKLAYIYEIEKAKGKVNLKKEKIKMLNLHDDGSIKYYYGGSIQEIKEAIIHSIEIKNNKAIKRIEDINQIEVDLCLCIQDGSLLDIESFELFFDNLNQYIFENIFFITPSVFVRYHKKEGFKEYERIV